MIRPCALIPLVAVIFALGVYPKPVLDIVNPAVATLLGPTGTIAGAAPAVDTHGHLASNGAFEPKGARL